MLIQLTLNIINKILILIYHYASRLYYIHYAIYSNNPTMISPTSHCCHSLLLIYFVPLFYFFCSYQGCVSNADRAAMPPSGFCSKIKRSVMTSWALTWS